jgi:hypothetical protein
MAQLRLMAEPDHVRIAVYDGSSAPPALRAAGDGDEGGRGLGIVRALSDGCGVADTPRGVFVKSLSFELRDV